MDTRERIVAEATRQLLDVGYAAFTMRSVQSELGISSGSMFHAFASKPALGAEVFVRGMRDYQAVAIRATSSAEPVAAIGDLVASHLGWVEDHRELAGLLFMTQSPEVLEHAAEPLAMANRDFFAAIADVLERAARAGLCRPLDVEVGHPLIIGPAQEYCRRWTRRVVAEAPTVMTRTFQGAAIAALRSTIERPT